MALGLFTFAAARADSTIVGPDSVCLGVTNTFSVTSTSTAFGYAWSITTNTANAVLIGPVTNASVDVMADTNGGFTLECIVDIGTTNETASTNITIIPPATITCPTNVAVNCFADVLLPDTNSVAATGAVSVTFLGDVLTTNTCLITIARTYGAINSCGATSTCTQTILVSNTNPPVFIPVPDRSFECGTPWDFDTPAALDFCTGSSNVTVNIMGGTTNALCGNAFVARRTWLAVDTCSNVSTFTQTITILDTTPPILAGVSNLTVECGTPWNFQAPVASDVCSGTNVTLTAMTPVTNALCGTTFAATQVWQATDACSNSAYFSQTVTVVDTTPPVITCASNRTVECGQPWTFDPPTASDSCQGTNVTITISGAITNVMAGGTFTATRTWKATDACSNSALCSQTVSVVDTTPPTISCPADMIVAEAPRDSGGAAVTFPAPVASDICDGALTLISSPTNGSIFPVGTNTVTWTAIDGSGNSNSCTFTIRVIPYRLFVVTNTDNAGPGSLRQALLDANDAPGENLILFTLPGGGLKTIHLLSALPDITSPVIIDGWSQSGSNQPPVIALDGTATSNSADGLVIRSGNSTVRGLAIYGFVNAIRIDGGGTNVIQDNFLGTDLTGTNAPGNSGDGIYVNSARNRIGGTDAGTGNLICGNAGNGITFDTPNCFSNIVQGNYLGLAADSASPLGNGRNGLFMTNQPSRNTIGGTAANSGNSIKFNGAAGVALDATAGSRNQILGNAIFANVGLGIDLGNDGITPNDADDSDTGPNDLQNFPILSDARSIAGTTTIEGTLTSIPNRSYRLEFFLNNVADPSGNGEGQIFLGASGVTVHGSGPEPFSVNFPVSLVYTQFITATATDPFGNTSEFSPAVQVRTPPVIEVQPVSTNAPDGSSVTLCASASGTPPIFYQWRLNGINIPGATAACYTIPSASIADGGTYTVIIANSLGALATATASLLVTDPNILNLPIGDNFTNAIELSGYGNGTNGILAGDSSNATFEPPYEPQHAGQPGGRSVWYHWCTPPGNGGVATFETSGSTFDTVMAVYQGSALSNLVLIANDEDSGGFYSSKVRFNAFYSSSPNKDNCYYIAIDGQGGAGGPFVLSWNEQKTPHMLPVILIDPSSQTVPLGATVIFTNLSVPECPSGHLNCNNLDHWVDNGGQKEKLTYQWYFNDAAIPGKTNSSLTISNVAPANVGNYRVRVFTPWQYLDSKIATLQINNTGDGSEGAQAFDKFSDVDFFANSLLIGEPNTIVGHGEGDGGPGIDSSATTVVRGYSGTQIFNTVGAGSTPGEVVCGVSGGASEWLGIIAEANGTLLLNTDGSTYDTVMAVFRRSPTNPAVLLLVNCDNNGGSNGVSSSLTVPVSAGGTNYVLVDGVNGASGILQLNYSLATTTILTVAGRTLAGANQVQVNGRSNLHFTLQTSSDLSHWTPLLTTTMTNSIFNFTDLTSIGQPQRFYRALILP